jgi:single-stranded-DNA-specific exonuclease
MVSFRLAPRINASGRMGDATMGVRLLTTDDPAEALNIARDLDSENRKRQAMEEEILISALEMIDGYADLDERRSIVLDSEDWHPGIIGIVASRLVERFFRPVILLSTKDGIAKGSARSISGFHIYQGLSKIEDILKSFGGHKYAAGLSIGAADIPDLVERFEEVVREMTTDDDFVPTLTVDAEITLSDIRRYNLLHEAKLLVPFGAGNPEPLFLGRGMMIKESRVVGNNHLRMVFMDKNDRWDAIAFGLGDMSKSSMDVVDAVFNLRENQWDRGSACELNVRGIKSA